MIKTIVCTIQELKQVNKKWFTPENKRFFNDINYKVLKGAKSKTRFLINLSFICFVSIFILFYLHCCQ